MKYDTNLINWLYARAKIWSSATDTQDTEIMQFLVRNVRNLTDESKAFIRNTIEEDHASRGRQSGGMSQWLRLGELKSNLDRG